MVVLQSWKKVLIAPEIFFPSLHNFFLDFVDMPVTTSSAERSFSTLKLLKSYLRSTMASDRQSTIALLHINQDISIDYDQVMQVFFFSL